MKTTVLRWGLLSTAKINQALIKPLRSSSRNRLTAVASRSQSTADAYAKENKIPRAFGSYEAMLSDPEIDVVYNSLPNHLHAEWTIKAVEAGKHVLCEKPLALSVDEVQAMADAARKQGKVVAEAFMYRHHPQTLKAKEIVNSGKLGDIKLVRGSFTIDFDRPDNYRLDPAMGGGSIWDVGCYPISYTRLMLGAEPLEVFGWQVTGKTGIDASFMGQMRFPNEVVAQFDCSFVIPYHTFMEVVGSQATLVIPKPFNPGLDEKMYLTSAGNTETLKVKGESLYVGEVEDMADAILSGKPQRMSLDDSCANVAAMVALLESARAGKPVSL